MKRVIFLTAALGLFALAGCGGDDPPVSAAPPAGGTPTTPTGPATTDFNVFAVQLALQQDAASERNPPILLDGYTFAFSDTDGGVFATVLPP